MKNKELLKKYILFTLFVAFLFATIFMLLANNEYLTYQEGYNNKINSVVSKVIEKYPDISEKEIIEVLQDDNVKENILSKYGYDISKDNIIKANNNYHIKYLLCECTLVILLALVLFYIFLKYNHVIDRKIDKIIRLVEKINRKEYDMNLEEVNEDRLSILTSEIYKTMISLKESAENSYKDKVNLKDSLQDISHQLKTPLTSIMINLDNIIDNPDMEEETRKKFIMQIKKDVGNINFLVQSILKLSKFEANSIIFIRSDNKAINIIDKAINNVISLCDLKNVDIIVEGKKDSIINCDFIWQTEALTNIIKNAVEHSFPGEDVKIKISSNNVYTNIEITNKGISIDKEDLDNIFKRFYKGKNASEDSVGIGLSLAKTIIEKDNGKVEVSSDDKKGTTFSIKYYK